MAISGILSVLGILFAIAGTVLLYIFVLPAKKRAALPKFFRILHDIFNFKSLLLELILKALYTFSTLACVFIGFFSLFSFETIPSYGYYYTSTEIVWTGWVGLIIMIFGPILVRLVYEGIMMMILLVKNTIEINNKLKDQNGDADKKSDIFENDFANINK